MNFFELLVAVVEESSFELGVRVVELTVVMLVVRNWDWMEKKR